MIFIFKELLFDDYAIATLKKATYNLISCYHLKTLIRYLTPEFVMILSKTILLKQKKSIDTYL